MFPVPVFRWLLLFPSFPFLRFGEQPNEEKNGEGGGGVASDNKNDAETY